MVAQLSQIDALTRGDHAYLGEQDQVYFLREYTSRVGYTHSETNRLILNLKKSVETRGTPQWSYKEKAIDQLGRELRNAINPQFVQTAIWVPVPPSKAMQHPRYDDRMTRVLRRAFPNGDIRELVVQRESAEASHASESRPSPVEVARRYHVDEACASPTPQTVVIVDDVLTTGCHFVAVRTVLMARFPDATYLGVFLARRVFSHLDV
jgi:hypothetical protein